MQQKYVYIFIYYNNCVDTQSRVLVIKVVALIYKFFFFFTVLHTFFSLLFDPYLYSTIKVTTKLTNMLEAMRRKMKIYQVNKKKKNTTVRSVNIICLHSIECRIKGEQVISPA